MKISLSKNVNQKDGPVAFMVFCYKNADFDYVLFTEEYDAKDYAKEQEELSNTPENT